MRFYFVFYIICAFLFRSVITDQHDTFPDDFLIGTATAAYQIEGAWNVSDKGESLWDKYTHTRPDKIADRSTGDVTCDSYHKYKEDIILLNELGVATYRLSFSWTRILPTGYSNIISKDGIIYYNNIINALKKNGIQPLVTLYHWDHPQIFQDMGGWTNEIMVDLFGDYARVVYKEFADRVKIFITINEPESICSEGYFSGKHAPGLKLGKYAEYQCGHNVLKAHARAYHIYDSEFRKKQKGKVGIVLNSPYFYPKNKNDNTSVEIAFQFSLGKYAHPIFSKEGDYPAIMKQRVAENSKFEGLERSRLPSFSIYWKNYIKGTFDFMGLNHYSSQLVEPAPKSTKTIYENDNGIRSSFDPAWPKTPSSWLRIVPDGFGDLLRKIKDEYNNPIVFVTENGLADEGTLEDDQRIDYLYSYIRSMLTAMKDGCNVEAYTVWSLLDNFEWNRGYLEKFGLHHVYFAHPNKTRTPKKSVSWLKEVIRTRKLLPPKTFKKHT